LSEIWSNAEMPSPNLRHANPPCARCIHANAHLVMLRRANCNAAPTPCRAVPCRCRTVDRLNRIGTAHAAHAIVR
jgi:hypothetical protein